MVTPRDEVLGWSRPVSESTSRVQQEGTVSGDGYEGKSDSTLTLLWR